MIGVRYSGGWGVFRTSMFCWVGEELVRGSGILGWGRILVILDGGEDEVFLGGGEEEVFLGEGEGKVF